MSSNAPIGVFDSGLGGLSVLKELKRQLPNENFIYLGDSGRNPYGPKSVDTVIRFTLEAASFLEKAGAKSMVIACNTATVAALKETRNAFPQMPVIGVVEPGCLAAAESTRNGHIVLLATLGTVNSGAHKARLEQLRPGAKVIGVPAPIFVALAEEGWLDGAVPDAAAERYLGELFRGPENARPDCLILGCTHFPPLQSSIRKVAGEKTVLVDPAALTVQHLRSALQERNLLREDKTPGISRYYVTADPERFARVGSIFLQTPLSPQDIEVVSLG